METLRDAWRDLPLDLATHRAFGDVEIVKGLKIDPELRRRPEVTPQTKGDVGRHSHGARVRCRSTAGAKTLIFRASRYTHAEVHRRQELIAQDLTGMHRRQPTPRSHIREIDLPPVHIFAFDGHGHFAFSVVVDECLPSRQKTKQIRHRSLTRMLHCRRRSPCSASNRLPDGTSAH